VDHQIGQKLSLLTGRINYHCELAGLFLDTLRFCAELNVGRQARELA
jgi:hypothetical protein